MAQNSKDNPFIGSTSGGFPIANMKITFNKPG